MTRKNAILTALTVAIAGTAAFMPAAALAGDCCRSAWSDVTTPGQTNFCTASIGYLSNNQLVVAYTGGELKALTGSNPQAVYWIQDYNAVSPSIRLQYSCHGLNRQGLQSPVITSFDYATSSQPFASLCNVGTFVSAQCQVQFADDDPNSGCNLTCL